MNYCYYQRHQFEASEYLPQKSAVEDVYPIHCLGNISSSTTTTAGLLGGCEMLLLISSAAALRSERVPATAECGRQGSYVLCRFMKQRE